MKNITHTILLTVLAVMSSACANRGNDQNYRELEHDRSDQFHIENEDRFDPQSKTDSSASHAFVSAVDDQTNTADVLEETVESDRDNPTVLSTDIDADLEAVLEVEKPKPEAGTILDRSGWQRTQVGPDYGQVTHRQIYFRDCPIDDTRAYVLAQVDTEAKINAAMSNQRARNYHKTNIQGGFIQPVKFGADIVLLPYYMVKDGHPFTEMVSPSD